MSLPIGVLNRGFPAGCLICLLSLVILPGPARGEAPSFNFENTWEHEDSRESGSWSSTDTIKQEYNLGWDLTVSPRLEMETNFQLATEDIIKSRDVDTKKVTPSLDVSFHWDVADLTLTAKDEISWTNEFGTPRKDVIDLGLELDFSPFLFPPPINLTYKINDTYQEGLEEKTEKKLEISTTEDFWPMGTLDLSYKRDSLDQKVVADSDTEDWEWSAIFTYEALLTSALKMSLVEELTRAERDDRADSGTLLLREEDDMSNTQFKLTLETFPDIVASLEYSDERENVPAEKSTVRDLTLSFEAVQEVVGLGSLTETIEITRSSEETLAAYLPSADTTDAGESISLELSGNPWTYIDYTFKLTRDDTDTTDDIALTRDDVRVDTLDFSLTVTPSPPVVVEFSVNDETTYSSGAADERTATWELAGTFQGDFLDVPNLIFKPTVESTLTWDREAGTEERDQTLKLEFTYTFTLPAPYTVELQPYYEWTESDTDGEEVTIGTSYKVNLHFQFSGWVVDIDHTGDFEDILEDEIPGGEWTLAREASLDVSREITGTITWSAAYTYKIAEDGKEDDDLETKLQWDFLGMEASLTYNQTRVFSTEDSDGTVTRKYTGLIAMDF